MPCLLLFASALRSSHSNLNDIAQLTHANTISRPARSFAATASVISVSTIANHVVRRKLPVDAERAQAWSDDEVLRRWTKLYTGPELVQQYLRDGGAGMVEAQLEAVQGWATNYRARLGDHSWYMRVLNESISRMANAEDGVTGRFWEGRFKSHALLDEAAVLTAMAYVDLNPIQAGLATVPEEPVRNDRGLAQSEYLVATNPAWLWQQAIGEVRIGNRHRECGGRYRSDRDGNEIAVAIRFGEHHHRAALAGLEICIRKRYSDDLAH